MQIERRLRARLAVRCSVPRGARGAIESFVRAKRAVEADFSTNVTGEKRRMAVLSLRWYQSAGAGAQADGRIGGRVIAGARRSRAVRASVDVVRTQMARRRKASVCGSRRNERGAKVERGIRTGAWEKFGACCLVWVQRQLGEGNNIGC